MRSLMNEASVKCLIGFLWPRAVNGLLAAESPIDKQITQAGLKLATVCFPLGDISAT